MVNNTRRAARAALAMLAAINQMLRLVTFSIAENKTIVCSPLKSLSRTISCLIIHPSIVGGIPSIFQRQTTRYEAKENYNREANFKLFPMQN